MDTSAPPPAEPPVDLSTALEENTRLAAENTRLQRELARLQSVESGLAELEDAFVEYLDRAKDAVPPVTYHPLVDKEKEKEKEAKEVKEVSKEADEEADKKDTSVDKMDEDGADSDKPKEGPRTRDKRKTREKIKESMKSGADDDDDDDNSLASDNDDDDDDGDHEEASHHRSPATRRPASPPPQQQQQQQKQQQQQQQAQPAVAGIFCGGKDCAGNKPPGLPSRVALSKHKYDFHGDIRILFKGDLPPKIVQREPDGFLICPSCNSKLKTTATFGIHVKECKRSEYADQIMAIEKTMPARSKSGASAAGAAASAGSSANGTGSTAAAAAAPTSSTSDLASSDRTIPCPVDGCDLMFKDKRSMYNHKWAYHATESTVTFLGQESNTQLTRNPIDKLIYCPCGRVTFENWNGIRQHAEKCTGVRQPNSSTTPATPQTHHAAKSDAGAPDTPAPAASSATAATPSTATGSSTAAAVSATATTPKAPPPNPATVRPEDITPSHLPDGTPNTEGYCPWVDLVQIHFPNLQTSKRHSQCVFQFKEKHKIPMITLKPAFGKNVGRSYVTCIPRHLWEEFIERVGKLEKKVEKRKSGVGVGGAGSGSGSGVGGGSQVVVGVKRGLEEDGEDGDVGEDGAVVGNGIGGGSASGAAGGKDEDAGSAEEDGMDLDTVVGGGSAGVSKNDVDVPSSPSSSKAASGAASASAKDKEKDAAIPCPVPECPKTFPNKNQMSVHHWCYHSPECKVTFLGASAGSVLFRSEDGQLNCPCGQFSSPSGYRIRYHCTKCTGRPGGSSASASNVVASAGVSNGGAATAAAVVAGGSTPAAAATAAGAAGGSAPKRRRVVDAAAAQRALEEEQEIVKYMEEEEQKDIDRLLAQLNQQTAMSAPGKSVDYLEIIRKIAPDYNTVSLEERLVVHRGIETFLRSMAGDAAEAHMIKQVDGSFVYMIPAEFNSTFAEWISRELSRCFPYLMLNPLE
ncbi:hypothetical protein BCR33DRAFT_590885 [Rhizoclosmatium globosum]|uniref:C2H2-type domain-containing protein n=1 Tax=Rhizoclosmatium globosum TaxID=329046 RepID=A0A1Y2B2K5_9FUNG|nr:hypothetical protein BCR33DRAFT_590885 [Rhizoclosmatium globosum]|eukprot:ORY28727.1 hypothetical protein BCR33DRAFT_590885 [Rhizoclosmatium globosum]